MPSLIVGMSLRGVYSGMMLGRIKSSGISGPYGDRKPCPLDLDYLVRQYSTIRIDNQPAPNYSRVEH